MNRLMVALVLIIAPLALADSSVPTPTDATPRPLTKPSAPQPDPNVERFRLPVGSSPVRGPASARVTIVEFSDFQCPFCGRAEATLTALSQKYGKDLRLVWKNLPLPFHQWAMPAARLAMAAHQKGRFWEVHDQLFARQRELSEDMLKGLAATMGVPPPESGPPSSGPVDEQIKADQAEAQRVGANGTPTFFINGRVLAGAQPLDKFTQIIDEELLTADKLLRAGVAPDQLYATLTAKGKEHADPPKPVDYVEDDTKVYPVNVAGAPVRGGAGARVTVVEFSDFQCPFCGRVEVTLQRLLADYPRDVRLVWKNQPLPFHQHAHLAAEAALEANAQGKFWPYHDKLFANQRALERADLERYAAEVGLDLERFKRALDGGTWRARVDTDAKEGQAIGAVGTPTFFINGRKLVGAQPYERFKARVDEELKVKRTE